MEEVEMTDSGLVVRGLENMQRLQKGPAYGRPFWDHTCRTCPCFAERFFSECNTAFVDWRFVRELTHRKQLCVVNRRGAKHTIPTVLTGDL